MKKLTFKDVECFILQNNCELLSAKYNGVDEPLKLKCSCGKTFERSFYGFKQGKHKTCNDCIDKIRSNQKSYTIDYVRNIIEIESDSGCKLLSNNYKNNTSKLNIQCKCGNVFITTFASFIHKNKQKCNICKGFILWDYDNVKSYIEQKSKCILLSTNYKNVNDELRLRCQCGNEFVSTLTMLKRQEKIQCNTCSNTQRALLQKHSYEYVKNFIEIESGSNCTLITNKYDNSTFQKLEIQCACGEIFETTFNAFLSSKKQQCNICGYLKSNDNKKYSTADIKQYIETVSQCKLLNEYTNYHNHDLKILCPCGEIFYTSFSIFKRTNKHKCNKCTNTHKYSFDEIKNIIKDESTCTLISDIYSNNTTPLTLMCECGNLFVTNFARFRHENKKQCNDCSGWVTYTLEDIRNYVINNSTAILLSDSYDNMDEGLLFECECGEHFVTTFYTFKKYNKTRCNVCTKRFSNPEVKVKLLLDNFNIQYKTQHKFQDCKDIKKLAFDFAIYDNDKIIMLIEVNGKQHYESVEFFGGENKFIDQQNKDNIKRKYCNEKNIKLLEIAYYDFNNIESILTKELQPLLS